MKTIRNIIIYPGIIACTIILGCSISEKTTNTYTEDIAQGTGDNIVSITERIFNRFSFTINQSSRNDNRIRFESDWLNRLSYPSEQNSGYEEARVKVIIEARTYRRSELTERRVYNVRFTGITEYRKAGEDNWESGVLNDDAENYLKEIAYELKTELERVLYR